MLTVVSNRCCVSELYSCVLQVLLTHRNELRVCVVAVSVSNYLPSSSLVPLSLPYIVETFCKYPFRCWLLQVGRSKWVCVCMRVCVCVHCMCPKECVCIWVRVCGVCVRVTVCVFVYHVCVWVTMCVCVCPTRVQWVWVHQRIALYKSYLLLLLCMLHLNSLPDI